jgi:hypothetical protein
VINSKVLFSFDLIINNKREEKKGRKKGEKRKKLVFLAKA